MDWGLARKCLLSKHEDLSSKPQYTHTYKMQNMAVHAFSPCWDVGTRRSLWACWSINLTKSVTSRSVKNLDSMRWSMIENNWFQPLASTHTRTQHIYTNIYIIHKHTHTKKAIYVHNLSWTWWLTLVTPTLRRLKEERPPWPTWQVPGQPGLCGTLHQNNNRCEE